MLKDITNVKELIAAIIIMLGYLYLLSMNIKNFLLVFKWRKITMSKCN